MSKKYVSLDRLADYDALIKQEIANSVSDKADSSHSHDGRYYTETEINTKIAEINATIENHNHDNSYDALGAAADALASAKTYADNAAKTVKNDLLNNAGEAYDTLKELGDLIDDNADAIDVLETVAAGKADKVHSHAIADVSGLQTALDGKAASSHGTHVSYSTTAPVMDGTASVGTASTVARSDHKHPTDTSRASKTDFDNHTSDTTAHMTSAQKTQLSTAYNHSQAAHAPSNAQANQNAFSNIAVSGQTTVAADTTTDTVTFVGSNVSITTDATNDKVTFTVADGSTSAKGVVQLTNSTSSTSTTTAATPNSVKSAYDLANTAKTNAATAQTRADNAYTLAEGKVDSLSDLGITATAAELNYVDGVTSAIQTQLNSKMKSNPASIELNPSTSAGHGGFIDFHYNGSSSDNTSRIIESASGTLSINGVAITTGKAVTATTFNGALNGNATSATKATQDASGNVITSTYATKSELDEIDWFSKGTSIPSGADLDTYTTLGTYYASNESTAKSLANCPVTSNFKLYVFLRTSGSSINQLLFSRDMICVRGANSSGTWSDWEKCLQTTGDALSISSGGTEATTAPEARANLGFTYGSAEPTETPETGEGSVYFRTGGDAVVEVGTSGIWTYRKWASGIAECWGSKTFTATISSSSGSGYYVKFPSAEDYPFTFAAVPQQFVTLQSGPYAAWVEINASSASWPSTTSTGQQMLASTVSRASGEYTVAYHVIGRWK